MNFSKKELIEHSEKHISNYIAEMYNGCITSGLSKEDAYEYLVDSLQQIKDRLLKTELPPACADWCESRDTIVANNVPSMWGFTSHIKSEIDIYIP